MQLESGTEFTPTEFKPSSAVETPATKKEEPKAQKKESEDEGIPNMDLDGDSDEGIDNVEIDVDFDDIASPAKEEAKVHLSPNHPIKKTVSIEDQAGSDDDEGTKYTIENLTPTTVYQFEEFVKIGEVALT